MIYFSDFADVGIPQLAPLTASNTRVEPLNATATYALNADGSVSATGGSPAPWLVPQAGMTLFEARATVTSGSLSSGTTGAWLALGGTDRIWQRNQIGVGSSSATVLFEIRRIGDTTVLASASVSFFAEVLPL